MSVPVNQNPCVLQGNFKVSAMVMTAAEWAKVPRNTVQRNEEIRKALHLKTTQIEHVVVAMARDTAGEVIKIDGHTRARDVISGSSGIKEFFVVVYDILDKSVSFKQESERLYESYDSRKSVKTASEALQGFMGSADINLKTDWLIKGSFSEALKLACSYIKEAPSDTDRKEQVRFMQKELELFDSILPKKNRFRVPFMAAALLMLRLDPGTKTIDMLMTFNNKNGVVFAGNKGNSHYYLNNYLSCGVSGDENDPKTWNGKFGTGHGFAQTAIHRIVSYMTSAVKNGSNVLDSKPRLINLDAFKDSIKKP